MGMGMRLGSAQAIIASEPNYTPEAYFSFEENTITLFSHDGIAHDQPAITVVSVPPAYGGETVFSIGVLAIKNEVTLTAITLPNSITGVGEHNFEGCTSLISVTVGADVTFDGFNNGFDTDYAAAGFLAGTYILTGETWVLQA